MAINLNENGYLTNKFGNSTLSVIHFYSSRMITFDFDFDCSIVTQCKSSIWDRGPGGA